MLAGVDKDKLEQVSNIVKNMSKDDLNNLVRMLGMAGNTEQKQNNN